MSNKMNKQLIAGTLSLALLVSGTFAWQSFSQIATNETNGIEADQGTRLHNYFDGSNADVFVENYARFETGATAYTRVKVLEYMEIGETAGALTGRDESALTKVRGDVENYVTPNINDKTTWDTYLHDSNDDATGAIRDYMSVSYGDAANSNKGQAIYMPTFNKDYESIESEINGKLEGDTSDRFTTDKYNDYVPYLLGETLTATATYHEESSVAQAEGTTSIEETHEAVKTKSGSVITMDKWITDGKNTGDFWVYDTDGWAYWANGLAPETATSVLIDSVSKVKTPDEDWYYGLHVINDSATANGWLEEMGTTGNDISDNALLLLEELGMEAEVFSVSIRTAAGATPSATYRETTVGESIELSAVVVASSTAAYYQDVEWSIDYPQGALSDEEYAAIFSEGKFSPVAGMEGNTYTVTVTSVANPDVHASVELSVIDLTADPTLEINNVYIRTSTGNIPSATYKETAVGGAISLKAEVATSFGNDVYQNVKWEISGNDVSSDVLVEGVFSPVAGMEGKTYTVTATSLYDDTKSDTLTLTVSNVAYTIDSVSITNANGGVPGTADKETSVGDSTTFAAAVYSSLGYETFQDMTWSISSKSTNITQAVMDTTISNGVFTPVEGMEGRTYTITATSKVDTSKSDGVEVSVIDVEDTSNYIINELKIVSEDGSLVTTSGLKTSVGDSVVYSYYMEASDTRDPQLIWAIEGVTENENDITKDELDKTLVNGAFTPVKGMEGNSYTISITSELYDIEGKIIVSVSALSQEEIDSAEITINFYLGYESSYDSEQGAFVGFSSDTIGLTSKYVEWHVEGNDSPSTKAATWGREANYRGGLWISADETVGNELVVKAVSTETSSVVSNEIRIRVLSLPADKTVVEIPGTVGAAVVGSESTITIDGVEFYVIAVKDSDGDKIDDQALLWSKRDVALPAEVRAGTIDAHGYDYARYNFTDESSWKNSYMRNSVLQVWGASLPTVEQKAVYTKLVTDGYYTGTNQDTATDIPDEETVDNIFLLSQPEILEYIGYGDSRGTTTLNCFTRSPHSESQVRAYHMLATSTYAVDATVLYYGVRPAFWVNL